MLHIQCSQCAGEMRGEATFAGIIKLTCTACGRQVDLSVTERTDDKAQQAEVADDTAGAIELLTKQRDEAEAALKLLHEESPGVAVSAVDLCCMCPAADHCGPKFPDSEPCKEFAAAEARHEKLAPVRKVLERMKP